MRWMDLIMLSKRLCIQNIAGFTQMGRELATAGFFFYLKKKREIYIDTQSSRLEKEKKKFQREWNPSAIWCA